MIRFMIVVGNAVKSAMPKGGDFFVTPAPETAHGLKLEIQPAREQVALTE